MKEPFDSFDEFDEVQTHTNCTQTTSVKEEPIKTLPKSKKQTKKSK